MQLVGSCDTNAKFYDIAMGPCDPSNEKAFWAFSGIGEIVHFECMVRLANDCPGFALLRSRELTTKTHSIPFHFIPSVAT